MFFHAPITAKDVATQAQLNSKQTVKLGNSEACAETFRKGGNIYIRERIEQKGMTFDHDFCYFILLFSFLFFLGGKRKRE